MAEEFKEIDYNSIVDVQDIMDNFNILRLAINNISFTDTEITVVAKEKMLSIVLKELEEAINTVENSLDQLELKDTAIDVAAEEKKLNVVLSELRDKDKALDTKNTEQDKKIDEYKSSVDDLNTTLAGYVARHKVANDGIHMIVGDKIE